MSTFSVNVHFWVNYSFKEVSRSTSFALFEAFFVQIQVTLYYGNEQHEQSFWYLQLCNSNFTLKTYDALTDQSEWSKIER